MTDASNANSSADTAPMIDIDPASAPAAARLFARQRFVIVPSALRRETCETILKSLRDQAFIRHTEPESREAMDFYTKNGTELVDASPEIGVIEREAAEWVSAIAGSPYRPIDNRRMAISVNVMLGKGGFYTHRDRNAVTIVAFLNDQDSGELLVYREYPRLEKLLSRAGRLGGRAYSALRRAMWTVTGPLKITPTAGTFVVFNHLLHRVADVRPGGTRVTLIIGLDTPDVSSKHINEYYGYGEAVHRVPELSRLCPA
jgi:hypothetical protein